MDVSKELIRSIVEKVLAESAGTAAPAEPYKEKDPSGIIKITTDKVETERFEQEYTGHVLKECGGNISKAAKVLNMQRSSLYNILNRAQNARTIEK